LSTGPLFSSILATQRQFRSRASLQNQKTHAESDLS
jgi:hypothetical protein